jgi:hypothetical protein
MAVSLVALYSMWKFWPTVSSAAGIVPPSATFRYFSSRLSLTQDQQFFAVAALAGAIGATIHGLRSLSTYIGERYLYRSWIPYYLMLPFVGALLATVVYLVLRAGFLPGSTPSSQPDPYGIAAIGAMVGLFSAQATEKLKTVFETLFTKVAPGEASISDNATRPVITGFDPQRGSPGVRVAISGHNLEWVTGVAFAGAHVPEFAMDPSGRLIVAVPEGATDGPLILLVGRQKPVVSKEVFVVEPKSSASRPTEKLIDSIMSVMAALAKRLDQLSAGGANGTMKGMLASARIR